MRGMTLTWTPISLILAILLTSPFPTQAQSRVRNRTITKAQIEQVVKNHKPPPGSGQQGVSETLENKVRRLLFCTDVRESCGGNGVTRSLVTKELLLRLHTRDIGEACTSSDGNYSTAMYDTPYRRTNGDFDDNSANLRVYEAWQDELLDTGLTFCNPLKHLICSSNSKKCECRPGTVLDSGRDAYKCSVIPGGNCWPYGVHRPRDLIYLYDPITIQFYLSNPLRGLDCPVNYDDNRLDTYDCIYGLQLFVNNTCANKEIVDLDQNLGNQFKDLPRLDFDEPCNLEHQTQFYTTAEAEVNDYKIRVKKLEAIAAAKTPFCDRTKLLICGTAGKCECLKPYVYNPEKKICAFKNLHDFACREESIFGNMMQKFPGIVKKEVKEGFQTALGRDCPLGCAQAMFPDGGLVRPTYSFCRSCPEVPNSNGVIQVVGKNCDKDLTLFLEGAPPPSLPIDIPDYEKQLELFVQFNEKAKEFEKLFRLEKNSLCDYAGELEVYRSIRGIKNVEVPDKVFTGQNYKDLMSSMDKSIGRFGGTGLCRYRRFRGQAQIQESGDFGSPPQTSPLLLCGPTKAKPICYEANNTQYLEILLKRLSGKISKANIGQPCAPHPKDILKYANNEIGSRVFVYLFDTLENLWIENSQFCNRTSGILCTKPVQAFRDYAKTNATGKCEFSNDLLEEVLADLERAETERLAKLGINSKSSCLSIQYLLTILLFIIFIIILN